jgi:NTP pyrophosphatase (non-canonical NTP hydrolase)
MNLKEYEEFTRGTAIYPPELGVGYCAYGLASEVGEVLGKLKKEIRDGVILTSDISKELGDVLWYWVRLCDELELDPQEVMEQNVTKLTLRKQYDTIKGSGDNR